jgi:hypothetical protein
MTSIDRLNMQSFKFPERVPEMLTPAEEDLLQQQSQYRPRPPSGSPSDDTMWDDARKPAASTSQLGQNNSFRSQLFIDGTPIYVEEVSPSPPYPLVHPYVSAGPHLGSAHAHALIGYELHVTYRSAGGCLMTN